MRTTLLCGIGIVAAGLVAAGAQTTEKSEPPFRFQVPVTMRRMPPEVRGFILQCFVANTNPTGMAGRRIGWGGSATFPITGGEYTGEVTVPVSMNAGEDPATVGFYECTVFLLARINGQDVQYAGNGRSFIPLSSGEPFIRLTPIPSR